MSSAGPAVPGRIDCTVPSPVDARVWIGRTYGWHIMAQRPAPPHPPSTMTMVRAGGVGSARITVPGELSYRVVGSDTVVFATLARGAVQFERAGSVERYRAGDSFLANQPETACAARTSDARLLVTVVSYSLVAEVAGTTRGRAALPLRFSLSATPARETWRRWRATAQFVDELLGDPAATAAPLVVDAATRMVAATALHTFPNNALTDPTREDRRAAHPASLRRAMAFIESHPERPLGAAQIARAAGVTVRAVQLAFRRYLNITPMEYLRRVRLDHAHTELLVGSPDTTTITDIARRWGYARPSRFAAAYRAAYGRRPSDTLGDPR